MERDIDLRLEWDVYEVAPPLWSLCTVMDGDGSSARTTTIAIVFRLIVASGISLSGFFDDLDDEDDDKVVCVERSVDKEPQVRFRVPWQSAARDGLPTALESSSELSCSPVWWEKPVTCAVIDRRKVHFFELGEPVSEENQAWLNAQFYRSCLEAGIPPPEYSVEGWNRFCTVCQKVVEQAANDYFRHRWWLAAEQDDLSQGVLLEILMDLPRLRFDSGNGELSARIADLAEEKIRRLARLASSRARRCYSTEALSESLCCTVPGPLTCLIVEEQRRRWNDALTNLLAQMTPDSRELFELRFVNGRSADEIAVQRGLSRAAVYSRCRRLKEALRGLDTFDGDDGVMGEAS
jgi:RNA polymerase sigma factor (sigma-70 family)